MKKPLYCSLTFVVRGRPCVQDFALEIGSVGEQPCAARPDPKCPKNRTGLRALQQTVSPSR
jgi:hypothetical protein